MPVKFVSFADKDEFESFIIGINQVNENSLIIFGAEIITCNTMDEDANMMFSGALVHSRSTLVDDKTFNVGLYLPAIIRDLAECPSGEIALMSDGSSFILAMETPEFDKKLIYTMIPIDPIELPKFDFPLKLDFETRYLEYIVDKLHTFPSIIFSRENNGLHIAEPSWNEFTTICPKNITYVRDTTGAFSTMISTSYMLKAFEILSLYETVLVGLGEDIPMVFLGTSDRLKMGFMIGAQVDEDGEGPD